MKKARLFVITVSALFLWGGTAPASTVSSVSYDSGTTWDVTNVAAWDTTGSTMAGMTVTVNLADGHSKTITWDSLGATETYGTGSWLLAMTPMSGSTWDTAWTLTNTTGVAITSIVIDGQSSAGPKATGTVFDVIYGTDVTPGSEYGYSIVTYDGLSTLSLSALYSNSVSLNGTIYGDLYRTLALTFAGTGYSGSGFTFFTDTDNVNATPEPASMVLFGLGLAGLAGIGKRIRKG